MFRKTFSRVVLHPSADLTFESLFRHAFPAFLCLIFLGFILNGATAAVAAPDGCVEEPSGSGIFICRGNQSEGVSIGYSAVTELNVKDLSPNEITPRGGAGITFSSTSGGNVVLKSGEVGHPVTIQTQGASGIVLQSSGDAPAPQTDTVLGIPVPGKDSVSGGVVQLESHTNITTTGDGAHGIEAQSSTTGYPQAVIDSLENFEEANVSFEVVSVDSSVNNVDQQVQAVLIDAAGEPVEMEISPAASWLSAEPATAGPAVTVEAEG